jgi:hypothetical protein
VVTTYTVVDGSIGCLQPNGLKRGGGPKVEEFADTVREQRQVGSEIVVFPYAGRECNCNVESDVSCGIGVRMARRSLE